ncbi:MauE/DoxX family redox-associated membrane protein [Kribbella catacumbae]|uniref:MauE/DoxX family redox-associated membrane protein n=1 Tax=Kribbella catacumbae TaxID=460086 RepID=UPI0003758F7B|nr:MauE/DoxX family redox-associated membrane protein [Kribbella catacumbae]
MRYLELGSRLALFLIFATSALSKVRPADFTDFRSSVKAMRVAPQGWAGQMAGGVVVAEVCAAALLALGWSITASFAYSLCLLMVFTVSQLVVIRRGSRVACRCFGPSTAPMGWPQVARNIVLIVICTLGITASGSTPPPEPGGVIITTVAAAMVALLLVRIDDLVALWLPHRVATANATPRSER